MPKPLDTPMYAYIHDVLAHICGNRAAVLYQAKEPGGALPDGFLTYYLVGSNPEGHFSNMRGRENARYSIQYADRDKSQIEPVSDGILSAMEQAGFLYITTSNDLYDNKTGHWSRTLDFRYIEEARTWQEP